MKKITWLSLLILTTMVFLSLNPNPTFAAQNSVTFQISTSNDDVNQDGTSYTSNTSTIWLGNNSSTTSSLTGLRFTNVSLPQGATILSAQLQVYSSQSQWISLSIQIAGDLSTNSAAFSSTNLPGQRNLTTFNVNSSTNTNWTANTWYTLPDISSVIQEQVNQSGWQSGNSLSLIIKGTGSSYARKFVYSNEGSPANSIKLIVTYQFDPAVTATITAIPSSTPTRTMTISPATATPGPTSIPSLTPTVTAGLSFATFEVNTGGSDVIPHQLIRTIDDRLYFFGYAGNISNTLHVYWTNSPGLPGSTGNFTGAAARTYPATIISVSPAYDGISTVHIITNSTDGSLMDVPYNIITNSFKPARVLDTGLITTNSDVGTSGVSAAFDATGNLNVAYWSGNQHIIFRAYQYNPATDGLINVMGPVQVDSAGSANHPNLAVSPLDNSLTIAWISQAASPASILTRTFSAGSWGVIQTANTAPVWVSPNSGINIDQGPALVIDSSGAKYLTYIENYRMVSPFDYGRTHFVIDQGSGWEDTYTGFYTHDPAIAINNSGNAFIIGHGYPLNASPCVFERDMCVYVKNSPGNWTPYLMATPTGTNSFDTSPSTKWSVVGYNRADTVEFVFPEAISGSYANTLIHYGRINPAGQSSTSTPTATTTSTPRATGTSTPTSTVTSTRTATSTATASSTPTAAATSTPTIVATFTSSPTPSATQSPTIGFTPSLTPTRTVTSTFTPTTTGPAQLTLQINLPADDANQNGTSLNTNSSAIWIGNGASASSSFTGLRFNNVSIPRGATIISAQIQLYSSISQWISININIAGDLSANSAAWSTNNLITQRTLTTSSVNSASNINWSSNTWYSLPDISNVVQAIVNQSSWQSGNSLSIIIKGIGSPYSRKFVTSDNGNPAFAPKLIIVYR